MTCLPRTATHLPLPAISLAVALCACGGTVIAGGEGGGGYGGAGCGSGGCGGATVSSGSGGDTPACGREGELPADADPLAQLQHAFAAHWAGEVHVPVGWVNSPSYPVALTFRPDGTYSADCPIEHCSAFYWGSDQDNPAKTYAITDLDDSGGGWGWLNVTFDDTSGSVTTGELRYIAVNEELSELTFEFWDTWGDGEHGPLRLELHCEPAAGR